jgi:hypothetical protein
MTAVCRFDGVIAGSVSATYLHAKGCLIEADGVVPVQTLQIRGQRHILAIDSEGYSTGMKTLRVLVTRKWWLVLDQRNLQCFSKP